MSEEFEYRVETFKLYSEREIEQFSQAVEKAFNEGWQPTTNGPCLALQTWEGEKGSKAYLVMYVFARPKQHVS